MSVLGPVSRIPIFVVVRISRLRILVSRLRILVIVSRRRILESLDAKMFIRVPPAELSKSKDFPYEISGLDSSPAELFKSNDFPFGINDMARIWAALLRSGSNPMKSTIWQGFGQLFCGAAQLQGFSNDFL